MGRWLVVNPPYFGGALYVRKKNINITAYYLVTVLTEIGVDAEVHNAACTNQSPDEVVLMLLQGQNPDVLIFPIIDGGALLNAISIIEKLKSRGVTPLTVLCGHGATVAHREILCQFHQLVDLVVLGEEEQTVAELAQRVCRNEHWNDIKGIAFVRDFHLFVTPARGQLEDLDTLPVLDSNHHHNYAVVLSSRGCTGACSFCNVNYYYNPYSGKPSWRTRSAGHVMRELQLLATQGVKFVEFADANFLGDSAGVARAYELQRLLSAAQLDLRFMINVRADSLLQHRSLIASLQAVGLRRVEVGFESYSNAHLKWFNKETARQDNDTVVDILSDLGLDAQVEFIMFTPRSNISDIRANLWFLKRVHRLGFSVRKALFNILRFENGSSLTETYRSEGKLQKGRLFAYDCDFEYPLVKEFYDLLANFYPHCGIKEYHLLAVARALMDGVPETDPTKEEFQELELNSERTVLNYFEFILEAMTSKNNFSGVSEQLVQDFSEAEKRITEFIHRRFPETNTLLQSLPSFE